MKRFKRLYVEITNVCNLDCSFCTKTTRPPRFMTIGEFEHILREAQPYCDHVYLHVKGEPTLHPKLGDFLEVCEEFGYAANITTNGTLLNDHRTDIIGKKALRQVNISLHSLLGIPSKLGMNNELYLMKYLNDIVAFIKRIRAQTNTNVTLRLWNMEDDDCSNQERQRNRIILDVLEREFDIGPIEDKLHGSRGIKIGTRFYLNHGIVFDWPSLEAKIVGERGYCLGLRSQLGILVDGTVIPCCLDGDGILNLGNVLKEPLEEIIRAPRSLQLLKGFTHRTCTEELCKRCGYRDRFGGEFRPTSVKAHKEGGGGT